MIIRRVMAFFDYYLKLMCPLDDASESLRAALPAGSESRVFRLGFRCRNVTVLPVVKVRRTGTGKNVVLPD